MDSTRSSIGPDIQEFDPLTSPAAEVRALNAFINAFRREGWPTEDPTTTEQLLREKRSIPASERRYLWAAWQDRALIGLASLQYDESSANRHAAEYLIEVAPAYRRRGVATRLLRRVADTAGAENRMLLLTWTSSLVPAAGAFMQRLRALEAQVMSINELSVAQLDCDVAAGWLARSEALSDRFSLCFWDGSYPEADLDAVVEMHAMMNTMPRDKLALEDERLTASQLREQEAILASRGVVRHTAVVRDRFDGRIAGYSEMLWNPATPLVLAQGDTAVSPECRGLGIATWLKAAMLERMLRAYPRVHQIRTWNGVTNAPMLRINEQLGFRERHRATNWQLTLGQLERYLIGKEMRA